MAVKFYSDLLNTYFDTQEDAEQAEKDLNKEEEKKEPAVEEPKNEKKALAKKISELDEKVEQAHAEYDATRSTVFELYEEKAREAEQILKEAKDDALKILKDARKKVDDALSERYSAICEFNDKFGVYTKQYSGKKAAEEFMRWMNTFNDIFGKEFRL